MIEDSSRGPRYIVPIRKEPIPVEPIIPAENENCIKTCEVLNNEIDRLSKTVKKLEEQSEGNGIYGVKRATRVAAHKMNILEDLRFKLKDTGGCKCFEYRAW